jgi:ketosteroid isomerase-like protein
MANSEVVERMWREGSGTTLDERCVDWWVENGWSPDVTWRAIEGAPDDVGVMHGPERVRRYFAELMELFEGIEVDLREIRDVGEKVVVRVVLSGRSRSTGMPVEIDFAVVYELDSTGRVLAVREYKTEAEAMQAAEMAATPHESAVQP